MVGSHIGPGGRDRAAGGGAHKTKMAVCAVAAVLCPVGGGVEGGDDAALARQQFVDAVDLDEICSGAFGKKRGYVFS